MAAYMSLEVAFLVEALGAQVALVWLFASVPLHVTRKVHLLVEAPAAQSAPKTRFSHRASVLYTNER